MSGYRYDPDTRQLFPVALQERYEASMMWPANGMDVPADIAVQYISDPDRDSKRIVGGKDGTLSIQEA